MFKLFIIILLSTTNLCYAKKLEQPPPLVFVNKNNYSLSFISNNYRVAGNGYNKFLTGEQYCKFDIEEWNNQYNEYFGEVYDGDNRDYDYYHLNRDGSDKFDHEFNEFITGPKYCKRGSTS
ncbi:hypothetical protein [Candidatus Trichorickettsia mobilis]|uniref:hypothetical protein n=1 Tax=Candidatus Trichorickettsia mobilis TaxID=1346319 RepID=UPI00292CED7A|nr:hypothetical protein [Candidatus Trichorickettsia mobilis]